MVANLSPQKATGSLFYHSRGVIGPWHKK